MPPPKYFIILQSFHPSDNILSGLQNVLVHFVWSNKRHLLKRTTLFQQPDRGGLGLASLQARIFTFRIKLIQRYLSEPNHPSFALFEYFLQKYKKINLDYHLLLCKVEIKYLISLPPFYYDIMRAWSDSGARIEIPLSSVNHVINIPLISPLLEPLIGSESNLGTRLFARGIRLLRHLLNEDTGCWLRTEDLPWTSTLAPRPPSHRLLQPELLHLRQALIANFPGIFANAGLRAGHKQPHKIPDRPSAPIQFLLDTSTKGLSASSKVLYTTLNSRLNPIQDSPISPWHKPGFLDASTNIQWLSIYKLPSTKKEGDVQFKLLHNVQPSLPVLHHLNTDIPPSCGWCGEKGTIEHLFITCPSIQPALNFLHSILSRLFPDLKLNFDIYWALVPWCRYSSPCQLFHPQLQKYNLLALSYLSGLRPSHNLATSPEVQNPP